MVMDAQEVEALINSKERILVIQTAFLGDALLTLPMLEKLKQKYSLAILDVLAIPATQEIFSASPYIDNVIVMDKKEKQKGLRALNKFIGELRKNSYTKIYSPHRSFRSAYITLKLGAGDSYGFDNSNFKYAYKHLIRYKQKCHEVQRNLLLIGENIEGESWKIIPRICFNDKVKTNVKKNLMENHIQEDFIAVAPGSVWETKKYPEEKYIELTKLLSGNGEHVVLIGGKEDVTLCDDISSNVGSTVKNLAGKLSVIETIFFLKSSKLLISNDSAPTHMGMCADIPVLTIFCSTIPEFGFYPYNKKSSYSSYNDLDCKPCGIHGYRECPIGTFDCANNLLPEKIMQKII